MEALVAALQDPDTRENALLDLSKKRDMFPDLAPVLWHSYGVISALLHEIVSIYPLLSPPSLTAHASNRVCNALALLQCVASHQDTRGHFLQGAAPSSTRRPSCDRTSLPPRRPAGAPCYPPCLRPSRRRTFAPRPRTPLPALPARPQRTSPSSSTPF